MGAPTVEEARDALIRGEAILRQVDSPLQLGKLLCARAELEQGSGDVVAAQITLDEADALVAHIGPGLDSELGHMVAKVRRTLAAKS